MRRFTVAFTMAAIALLAAACGSSTTEAGTSDTTVAEPAAQTETTEAMEEEAKVTETTEAVEEEAKVTETTEAVEEAAGDGVPVSLTEFVVGTDAAAIVSGSLTFDVVNDGEFPHEFGAAKGDSYDDFAHTDNGAIDEDALGADLLGKTAKLEPGDTETISFDLEPGNYVFFCNINSGPNSHAQKGQVLSVTVG